MIATTTTGTTGTGGATTTTGTTGTGGAPTRTRPQPAPAGPRPPLERREPLAHADAMAERARHGQGGVLLLTGAAGTGRSTLLAAVADHQAQRGTTVLWARCSADESDRAYAAARQLFNPGAQARGPLARTLGAAGHTGPPPNAPTPESDLWDLLLLHASHGPLLLAVDDVQAADAPSWRWLHQVGRRIDRLPVLLAVTERRQRELHRPSPRFGRTLTAPPARTCRIGALSRPAAAELAAHRLAAPPPGSLLDDCMLATGGNPLLLDALLTDLDALPTPPEALPPTCAGLPFGAFPDAVDLLLHGCGPDAAAVARTLAQLQGHWRSPDRARPQQPGADGHPDPAPDDTVGPALPATPSNAELAELTGADPERLADWLADLTARGTLRAGPDGDHPHYGHPLLRAAVLAGWDAPRRAEAHRAAALLLHRRGDPDPAIAAHLLHVPGPAARWAADVLLGAARTARGESRPEQAATLLRRALDESLPDRRRGAALTELGCLELSLGADRRAAGIRHLAEAVHLRQSDEGLFAAANALGAALAAQGETAAALEVFEELAERLADREDLTRAVRAAAALISSHDGSSWLLAVQGLRRLATRMPRDVAPAVRALLTEFDATSGVLGAAEVARRVRELTEAPSDPLSQHFVLASAATLAQWAECLPEADRLVARGMAAHRGPLLHSGYQCLLSVRAESHVMRGRYRPLLDECQALVRDLPAPARRADGGTDRADSGTDGAHLAVLSLGNAHLVAQSVIALTELGLLDQAHELADGLARSAGADGAQSSWEWNEYLYARGLLHLAAGRPATALADLLECGRRQRERQAESPIVTPWRSAAADCQVLLGLPGPAVALAAEELRLAEVWGTPRTVGRAMRALGSAVGGRQGLDTAARAVDLLRTADVATELLPALITLGRLLTTAGHRAAARRTLREAVGRAERLGAVRLRSVAVDLLRASGARRAADRHTGAPALTASEERICRLADAGHSNAEIAAVLHLAVRTVETHLTNSFRKLGVRRRAELAGRFEQAPPPAPPPELRR